MNKAGKFLLYAGVSYLALNAVAFHLPVTLLKIGVATLFTGATIKGAMHLASRYFENEKYPEYKYKAADGSQIIVDPARQRVTRRLSKDFARAADFRNGTVSDVVTKDYSNNPIVGTVQKVFDYTLNFTFNKYASVNTKTMRETREFDQGATEVFIMEKYLKHAQEQYQKDLAAKTPTQAQKQKPRNSNGPSV